MNMTQYLERIRVIRLKRARARAKEYAIRTGSTPYVVDLPKCDGPYYPYHIDQGANHEDI